MNDVFNYLAENSWARYTLLVAFLLIIARRATIRYFRGWMQRKSARQEADSYEILRREISTLTKLYVDEQKEKLQLMEENSDLKAQITKLTQK